MQPYSPRAQTGNSKTGEGQTESGETENGQTTGNETSQVSDESDRGASEETSSVAAADILTEYTVRKGDSLSKISERYYGTMNRVKDICAVNGITSEDVIYAGQKILLPK